MNIILIGYGKMGQEIEKLAIQQGHSIAGIIDINNRSDLNQDLADKADVAIEFTSPPSVLQNIYSCFELGIPLVTGTTGWHDKYQEVASICLKNKNTLFHASNYSIGVNLFFAVNEKLAEIMDSFPQYDVSMEETHHTQKLDAPSGTAISTANIILGKLSRKTGWSMDSSEKTNITINAIREGDVKGIHNVKYESEEDFIELTHHAKSRKGFAFGAIMAAEFIKDKEGIFTMHDLLGM